MDALVDALAEAWTWLLDPDNRGTLGFVGAALAAVVAAGWAIYGRNRKKQTIITLQDYEAGLRRREAEIRAELKSRMAADAEERAALEADLSGVNANLSDVTTAYEEQKERLQAANQALDDFGGDFGPDEIERAREALQRNETEIAEALFRQALKKGAAQAGEAAFQLGKLAEGRIDYEAAREHFDKAVQFDPGNSGYLNAAGRIAYTLGYYAEAQQLIERSLAINEKTLGPDHPSVAATLNNLAELYKSQGRYAEAEPLYKRDLDISEKALGPDHPSVATTLNNLAGLYESQGRYAEAEPLYKRSLAINEKALGPDHPSVATILNNLAELYKSQGRYGEAEPLYKRALRIAEAALGGDHPNVVALLKNYADLMRKMGKVGEAAALELRAEKSGAESDR